MLEIRVSERFSQNGSRISSDDGKISPPFFSRRLRSTSSAMGVLSPYMSSAINTTDEVKKIEELGGDIYEMELVDAEIEEPDLPEVMDLTTEPSAHPVRNRRCDLPSVANLTTDYLQSIGVYDDDN